jgi:hypothetical protein
LNLGFKELLAAGEVPDSLEMTIRPMGGGHIMKTPFFVEEEGVARIVNDIYRAQFPRLPLRDPSVTYGFCGNLHTTRVLRDVDWSEHAPAGMARRGLPVSSALLHEIFHDDQKYMLALLDLLRRSGASVFVIEGPYPFRHHRMFAGPRTDVLMYIEREYRRYAKRELERRGIEFVAVPADCIDKNGFMLDRYRHPLEKDQHHGNTEFGALMMRRVIQHLMAGQPRLQAA